MALSMAAPATPQTPTPQAPQLHTPNGTWKHPKFDEITRRQYATTFDESNVKVIVANAGLLAASFFANAVTSKVKLLGYAACVYTEPLLGSWTDLDQNTGQRSRTPHPLQRMGHPSDPPLLRRKHRQRLPAPRPPLLPRRHRRHPPDTLPAHLNGSQAQLLRLHLRFARVRLRNTAALLSLHATQQLQQPGRAPVDGFRQPRSESGTVDKQHIVLARPGWFCEQAGELRRRQPVQ